MARSCEAMLLAFILSLAGCSSDQHQTQTANAPAPTGANPYASLNSPVTDQNPNGIDKNSYQQYVQDQEQKRADKGDGLGPNN